MIKVIIEREVAEGLEFHYEEAVSKLLHLMTLAPGYISGESLVDVRRPNHYIVIARWASKSAWQLWFKSDKRKQVLDAIAPFLQTDEKFTVLKQLTYHNDQAAWLKSNKRFK